MSGEHTIGGSDQTELTGVNWLTRVNQLARCVKKVERTRTVGFKIPEPLVEAYSELPSVGKRTIKTVVMSLIYALALKHNIDIECQEQLKNIVSEIPLTSGSIIINANINHNDVKPEVNVSIDLGWLKDVVSKLYELRQPLPPLQRKLVEQLYEKLRKVN